MSFLQEGSMQFNVGIQFNQYPLLSRGEEAELSKLAQNGDSNARAALIKCNLRLVAFYAQKYSRFVSDIDDIFQAGVLGLIRSIESYNPELGGFGNYATHWIRSRMFTYIARNWSSSTPNHDTHVILNNMKRGIPDSEDIEGITEFSEKIGLSVERTQIALTQMQAEFSYDHSDGDNCFDFPCNNITPDKLYEHEQYKEAIREVVNKLPPNHRDIITYYYLSPEHHTDESIGDLMGLTRSRVHQLRHAALLKLKRLFSQTDI
jgi:RNA polymerase sigma factor (sigma-70 family)